MYAIRVVRRIKPTWITIFLLVLLTLLIGWRVLLSISVADDSQLPIIKDIGGNFELVGTEMQPVGLRDFRGKVVMLTFGYTHCPDTCPTTMLRMKRLRARLNSNRDRFVVLFVTLDPERDTPRIMGEYVEYFDAGIVGLTGALGQIRNVTSIYKTTFKKVNSRSKAGYMISHSDFIYLIDGKGRTRGIYHHNEPLQKISGDVQALLAKLP